MPIVKACLGKVARLDERRANPMSITTNRVDRFMLLSVFSIEPRLQDPSSLSLVVNQIVKLITAFNYSGASGPGRLFFHECYPIDRRGMKALLA